MATVSSAVFGSRLMVQCLRCAHSAACHPRPDAALPTGSPRSTILAGLICTLQRAQSRNAPAREHGQKHGPSIPESDTSPSTPAASKR